MPKRVSVAPRALAELDEYWVQDRHGAFVAATVPAGGSEESHSGIWRVETGELVWQTTAACWLPDGDLLVVTSENAGNLERRTWPGRELRATCPIRHREGWCAAVVAAPSGALAAVRWLDQTASGFELFELADDAIRQSRDRGYRSGESNHVEGPVFSPSSRLAVVSEGWLNWWHGGPEAEADPEDPSPGGTFECGRVTVFDVDTGEVRHHVLAVDVPAGFVPQDEAALEGLLPPPRFDTDTTVVVTLATGEERRVEVGA